MRPCPNSFFDLRNYPPFGMLMPGRSYTTGSAYRFGFNGKENDNEVKGEGDQQDYGMRIYDPRLARFFSIDPLTSHYSWYSPYSFSGNSPIMFVDLDGSEEKKPEPPKQNIIIMIPSQKEVEDKTYDKVGGDQGNWFVIVANDMVDAQKQFGKYVNHSDVNNVCLITHGALVSGTIMLSNNTGLYNAALFKKYGANTLRDHEIKAQITAFKKISGLIKPGGNLVIAACLTGNGKEGANLSKSMKDVLNDNINLFVSRGVVTGPDPDVSSYNNQVKAFTDLKLGVPLIKFYGKYYDDDGNTHRNKPGEGFLFIGKNSDKAIDIGMSPGYTGNIILHESGATPIELPRQLPSTNKKD